MNTNETHLNSFALTARQAANLCVKLGRGYMSAIKAHDWSLPVTGQYNEQGAWTPQ